MRGPLGRFAPASHFCTVMARPWLRVTITVVAGDDADIWGWSESHTWAVDGSRSGRRVMVLRRSRSQMMVP